MIKVNRRRSGRVGPCVKKRAPKQYLRMTALARCCANAFWSRTLRLNFGPFRNVPSCCRCSSAAELESAGNQSVRVEYSVLESRNPEPSSRDFTSTGARSKLSAVIRIGVSWSRGRQCNGRGWSEGGVVEGGDVVEIAPGQRDAGLFRVHQVLVQIQEGTVGLEFGIPLLDGNEYRCGGLRVRPGFSGRGGD